VAGLTTGPLARARETAVTRVATGWASPLRPGPDMLDPEEALPEVVRGGSRAAEAGATGASLAPDPRSEPVEGSGPVSGWADAAADVPSLSSFGPALRQQHHEPSSAAAILSA